MLQGWQQILQWHYRTGHVHYQSAVLSDLGESWINSRQQGQDNAARISGESYFLPLSTVSEATSIISIFLLTQFFYKVTRWPPSNTSSRAASHYATITQGSHRRPAFSNRVSIFATPYLHVASTLSPYCDYDQLRVRLSHTVHTELLAAAQAKILRLYAKSDGAFGSIATSRCSNHKLQRAWKPGGTSQILHPHHPKLPLATNASSAMLIWLSSFAGGTWGLSVLHLLPQPARKASLPTALFQVCLVSMAN